MSTVQAGSLNDNMALGYFPDDGAPDSLYLVLMLEFEVHNEPKLADLCLKQHTHWHD